MKLYTLGLLYLGIGTVSLWATDFYVAPSGSSSGTGTINSPWDLKTALAHPVAVKPGDTIWLRGGTYRGTFVSKLRGTASAPIKVRQRAGERAIIDGGNSGGRGILGISGVYTWFWGFEVMSSDSNRVSSQSNSWPTDIGRGEGVQTDQCAGCGVGTKLINLVIHDTRQGVSLWQEALESEVYGCVIYNNGWTAPDRWHGHGIYTQNQTGTKRFIDNIVFDQFSHGFHAYGSESAYLNNLYLEGNVLFSNADRNLLLGGGTVAQNPTLTNNYTFDATSKLGYGSPVSNMRANGNYFVGPAALELKASASTITGNTFVGRLDGFTSSQYPSNSYFTTPPSRTDVFVRPNRYDPGRANIIIYNWKGSSAVSVDVSSVLDPSDRYELRDVMNYNGSPVLSGTYPGGSLTIPMNMFTVAQPNGNSSVRFSHNGPSFVALVLIKTSASTNKAPVVNAGGNLSVQLSSSAALNGVVTDDGQPNGSVTTAWSKLSGPGTVTFGNAASKSTTARFSTAGTYVLRLTASDSALTDTDEVSILVSGGAPAPAPNPSDSGSPIFSNVQSSVTSTTATIRWITSEPSDTQVVYGIDILGQSTPLNSAKVTNHSATLSGLSPGSLYFYRVKSRDLLGNLGVSVLFFFRTTGSTSGAGGSSTGSNSSNIILEAENAALTAPMASLSNAAASGGRVIRSSTANTGLAVFTVNIPASGNYRIWSRVLAPLDTADSFFVSVDGGPEDVYDTAEGTWSSAWQWTRVNGRGGSGPATINPRLFSLTAGTHRITFRAREAQATLDKIIVTANPNFVPSGL